MTTFSTVYDSFLSKITDDMYMEMSELDTYRMLEELLLAAIQRFEFPRVDLTDYELGAELESTYSGVDSDYREVIAISVSNGNFNANLTQEEINIIAVYMIVEWLSFQLASVENARMKYSGSDFKFTSQANHMAKLKVLIDNFKTDCFHLQRLYKRRKIVDGEVRSTAGIIMTTPTYGYNID